MVNHFSIFNIVFYEFISSTFLTYCVIIYGGTTTFPGVFVTIIGMFVAFLWSARFSGTYLNPALVIACMIKKERSVPLIKGIVLILVEFLGALAGTFIAWGIAAELPIPFQTNTNAHEAALVFTREVIGTFLYITIVLILVSSDTTFVEMEIQVWLTMLLILVTICEMI